MLELLVDHVKRDHTLTSTCSPPKLGSAQLNLPIPTGAFFHDVVQIVLTGW